MTTSAPRTTVAPAAERAAGWPELDGHVPVGAFAPAYLRPDLSAQIVVAVHEAAPPIGGQVERLVDVLRAVTAKPVSVERIRAAGGRRDWKAADLVAFADATPVSAQGDGVAVLHLIVAEGTFEGNDGVLGVAVRGDVAAVFVDRVTAASGLLGNPEPVARAVTVHEVGHLLGLVDLHLDTGRADPEHPGHSPNRGSVMYWAVESGLIGQLLGANPPQDFDDADLGDLRTIARGG